MPKFGARSLKARKTLHPKLQEIVDEAIKHFDFSIIAGHRGEKEQNEAYKKGTSKLKYPLSQHNTIPSRAVDLAPYPVDWKDLEGFIQLSKLIKSIAEGKGIKIRCGVDWRLFRDYPHYELWGDE